MNTDLRSRWFDARSWSFAIRLTLSITLLTTATLAAVTYVTAPMVRDSLTDQIGESYMMQADSLSISVNSFLKEKVAQIATLALASSIGSELETRNAAYTSSEASILAEIQALDEQWVSADDDDPLIQSILTTNPALNTTTFQIVDYARAIPAHTEILVTDRYGATLGATARLPHYYQADKDWWQAAWNDGEGAIHISGPEVDESAGSTVVLIAVPVFHKVTGQVQGIIRSTLNTDQLFALVGSVKLGRTGHAILLDHSAEVLYESAREGQAVTTELPLNRRQQLLQAENYIIAPDADGDQSIWGHQSIAAVATANSGAEMDETEAAIAAATANLGWVIAIKQGTQEAFASVDGIARNILIAGLVATLLAGLVGLFIARLTARPLLALATAVRATGEGDLAQIAEAKRRDEIGVLARAFNSLTTQLRDLIASLEQRVTDRTRELEERAVQLATAAEVGRAATSILDLERLAPRVVDLVRERFGLYYAALFLVDEENKYAVLEAGTGEAGRVMKEKGHRLTVGSPSTVGTACALRQARIALDIGAEPARFDSPLLPHTRSEMALPLMVGNRVVGALDVQSTEQAAFAEEDVTILQLVADQVAVAVVNARRFSEEAEVLEATSPIFRASRQLVSAGTTDEIVQAILNAVAETEADGCTIARFGFSGAPDDEIETVAFLGSWDRSGKPRFPSGVSVPAQASHLTQWMVETPWTVDDISEASQMPEDTRQILAQMGHRALTNVPLRAGERIIGFMLVYRVAPGPFSPMAIRLYETMADQAAVALERTRLLEGTQHRAARERLMREITNRMRLATDMDSLMQITVQEMATALQTSEAFVHLGPPPRPADSNGNETESSPGGSSLNQT